MSCIFCKIVSKEIPSQIIYENEKVVAFNDINPSAPFHILVVPKKHIESIDFISSDDDDISAAMFTAVKEIAKIKNLSEFGYRIIINNGKAAGQEVFHLHMHILGGKENMGPMLQS
jgi:histidine triad (HIT) family protein